MPTLQETARMALPLLDLTSLNESDSAADIAALCARAATPAGPVAALCVWPRHVSVARQGLLRVDLQDRVKVATVINFPTGANAPDAVVSELEAALASGADEIDLVFPYRALMAGDKQAGYRLVSRCRQALDAHCLKVILETGELKDPLLIRAASEIAIEAGADFIKTSTGKVTVNATLEAARIMLQAIADSGRAVGFKAAGGIRTTAEAGAYLDLAADLLGEHWLRPERFRFGASSLLDDLLQTLGLGSGPAGSDKGY
ncbi:MAG: deoxyribose-phosphate aldolase [Wenzhouxiangella sp.]|nr:MAG: deoxyribose-phosphate aldolase [Wenzhouxiangella sp.]